MSKTAWPPRPWSQMPWTDIEAELRGVAQLVDAVCDLSAEGDAARAEIAELRAALAAERGHPDGAPSKDWESILGTWHNTRTGAAVRRGGWPVTPPHYSQWSLPDGRTGAEPTARAAMLAADAAHDKGAP